MKKKLIILAFVIAPALIIGLKALVYFEVRSFFPNTWDNLEMLENTPAQLKLGSKTEFQAKEISIENLFFALPDKEIKSDSIYELGRSISYTDGSTITVYYTSGVAGIDVIKQLTTQEEEIDPDLFISYFEDNNIKTNYELMSHFYALKPSDISWFSSNSSIRIRYALLRLKEMFMPTGSEEGFQQFETENFKGFISGDINKRSMVLIEGFSDSDGRYTIVLEGIDEKTTIEILQRIRKVEG